MNISIKKYLLFFPTFIPPHSNHFSQRSSIMRKLLFPLAIIFQFAFAQEVEVTNIQVNQRTDGSKIVDITYDLSPDAIFEYFEVDHKPVKHAYGFNFHNKRKKITILIDEVYQGLGSKSAYRLINKYRNLIILRSFLEKFFVSIFSFNCNNFFESLSILLVIF